MTRYINGKLQENNYSKHAVYVLHSDGRFMSVHNMAYGYIESNGIGVLTFIKKFN